MNELMFQVWVLSFFFECHLLVFFKFCLWKLVSLENKTIYASVYSKLQWRKIKRKKMKLVFCKFIIWLNMCPITDLAILPLF